MLVSYLKITDIRMGSILAFQLSQTVSTQTENNSLYANEAKKDLAGIIVSFL